MVDARALLRRARQEKRPPPRDGEGSAAPKPPPPPSPSPSPEPPPSQTPSCAPPDALWPREWRGLRILEDPTGSLSGGNGATVWDSALVLADFLSDLDSEDWRGKRVLDLGAGCGLCSLALAARGADVLASERRIALPLLRRNVEANRAAVEGGAVEVVEFDWLSPDAAVLADAFDVVVGADLVFASNSACHAPLAAIVGDLARRGARIYVASELREGGHAVEAWLAALEAADLAVTRLHVDGAPAELRVDKVEGVASR